MDVLTHALVPYAGALAARGLWRAGAARPDAERDRRALGWCLVLGAAAAAPDADALVSWAARAWDGAYFLQHRGLSHTLWGAPLFGLAALGALAALARIAPRAFGLVAFRRGLVGAAVLGSLTHLILDAVTLSGVPLFWPFSFARVSTETFSWLVWWLFPVSLVVLVAQLFRRIGPRGVIVGGAVVLAVLLVLAGVRVATRPAGEFVYPRALDWEWMVLSKLPNGSFEAHLESGGRAYEPVVFPPALAPPAASEAIARAREHDAYRGFLMESYGPQVTRATPLAGGGWNVTFFDVAARAEALHHPAWTPARPHEAWGEVAFHVGADGGVVVKERGW